MPLMKTKVYSILI